MTLKDIAKQLDVPESSLRKYRELFSDFIPGVGTGRSRRYRTEAIEVLKDIRDLREEQHMPWDAITGLLAEKYPIDATPKTPAPAQTAIPLETETRELEKSRPVAPPAQQQPMTVASGNGNNLLGKFLAISEKNMMMMNAMALQMMQAIDCAREEARADNKQLRENISRAISSLASAMNATLTRESESIEQIKKQLSSIEENIGKMAKTQDTAAQLARYREELKIARAKLEQKENSVEEIKKAFDVLKKENASLREFKSRHLEHCEDNTREAKAMKKTSPIKRLLGLKP